MDLESVRRTLLAHRHLFKRAYVHGSVARGTEDEHSDVDVVLIRETPLQFFDRIRDLFDLVFALGKADMLVYTEAEYQELVNGPGRYFLKSVFEKGVRIEGAQVGGAPVASAG
jgi:predicted nucleotidyltransferase